MQRQGLDLWLPGVLVGDSRVPPEEEVADTIWLYDVVEKLMEFADLGYDNVTFRVEGDDYVIKLRKEHHQ